MRSALKKDNRKACFGSMVENDRLIISGEAGATVEATMGVAAYQHLVCVVLKTQRFSRQTVRFHAWPSCTKVATAVSLERRDLYEAE